MTKLRTIAAFLVVIVALAVGMAAVSSRAADHLEAPLVQTDGRLDINDIYAFQSPSNPDNTVLIMTVNPVAGVLNPTTLRPTPGDRYIFHIDNDGDYIEDIDYILRANPARKNGNQRMNLYRLDVDNGQQRRVAAGNNNKVNQFLRNDGMFFAGLTDDPFFFDLQAFLDQVKGAGGSRTFCDDNAVNFFAGLNVTSIAIEVPSARLTGDSSTINVWAETRNTRIGTFDRMGKPAIATVLIKDGNEDAFNMTHPSDDLSTWGPEVNASLQALNNDAATADLITSLLLPDVLTLDTSSTAGFVSGPLNGRQLADDVIDFELFVVTGGLSPNGALLNSDCIDNDSAFSGTFPYLAPPN